jgi:hypothetical protein
MFNSDEGREIVVVFETLILCINKTSFQSSKEDIPLFFVDLVNAGMIQAKVGRLQLSEKREDTRRGTKIDLEHGAKRGRACGVDRSSR